MRSVLSTRTDFFLQDGIKFLPISVAGFAHLPDHEQQFVGSIIGHYQTTFSEAQLFTEAAVDLHQWGTISAEQLATDVQSAAGHQKNQFIRQFLRAVDRQRMTEPRYGDSGKTAEKNSPGTVAPHTKENKVFGMCPVASDKTVCCNLRTIDAVTDCALGCNYCAIQTMFSGDHVAVDTNLAEKLRSMRLDKQRFYHFGTGQSSDSLLTGNRFGILDALMDFCRTNENVFLEFKSKSSNIAYFEGKFQEDRTVLPRNMFFSWSVNPQIFIDAEEPHTAPLSRRLRAAKKMVEMGFKVAFHFHPLVYFFDWEKHYRELCDEIFLQFEAQDIVYFSLGSMTIPRSVRKKIRSSGLRTNVTKNLTHTNPENKLTYPPEIKQRLFGKLYEYLSPFRDRVFFYLCMEEAKYWRSTFGFCHETNAAFESAMLKAIGEKIPGGISPK